MNKKENITLIQKQNEILDKKIKEENKKASAKCYLIMLLSGIGGGIGGFLMVYLNFSLSNASKFITDFIYTNGFRLSMIMSVIMVVLTIILAIFVLRSVARATIKVKTLMEVDYSDELEKVDKKQGLNLWITNGLFILHFLFFTVTIFMSKKTEGLHMQILIMTLIVTAVFLADTLVIIKLQQKIIDLIRIMKPEKQGSIYDIKFRKKWEASCDEAELMQIYRAGYMSYKVVNIFSVILWSVFMFIGIGTGTGFLPSIVVLVMWALSTCVYCYYTI